MTERHDNDLPESADLSRAYCALPDEEPGPPELQRIGEALRQRGN